MNNKIMFLWGFIIFMICCGLIILGNIGGNYELYKLERSIKHSAKEYFKDEGNFPKINNSEIVFIDKLIEENYVEANKKYDEYCIKGIKVTHNLIKYNYEIIKECKLEIKDE